MLARCEEARLSHEEAHSSLCRLMRRLIKAAGGRNPLDRNPGAAIQLANIAKMILRNSVPHSSQTITVYVTIFRNDGGIVTDLNVWSLLGWRRLDYHKKKGRQHLSWDCRATCNVHMSV